MSKPQYEFGGGSCQHFLVQLSIPKKTQRVFKGFLPPLLLLFILSLTHPRPPLSQANQSTKMPKTGTFSHISLSVSDYDAGKKYYNFLFVDILGYKQVADHPYYCMWALSSGECKLLLVLCCSLSAARCSLLSPPIFTVEHRPLSYSPNRPHSSL